jgi:hypothetical protein
MRRFSPMLPSTCSYRWNMRVEEEWVARVKARADRLGITAAAYVTMAVNERLEKDEAAASSRAPGGKRQAKGG